MELETRNFYERAMQQVSDAGVRKLLGDLADAERKHSAAAHALGQKILTDEAVKSEDATERRLFLLQIVQPGLAGLMDGSVSTLAPVFAAAFATKNTWDAFLVGLAASVGAGISMGFAEALSDDGSLTGRGHPWIPGFGKRPDDHCRRYRAHASIFDRRLSDCLYRGAVGGDRGAGRNQLHSSPLHGYAAVFRDVAGDVGWIAGVFRGPSDRQLVKPDAAGLAATAARYQPAQCRSRRRHRQLWVTTASSCGLL